MCLNAPPPSASALKAGVLSKCLQGSITGLSTTVVVRVRTEGGQPLTWRFGQKHAPVTVYTAALELAPIALHVYLDGAESRILISCGRYVGGAKCFGSGIARHAHPQGRQCCCTAQLQTTAAAHLLPATSPLHSLCLLPAYKKYLRKRHTLQQLLLDCPHQIDVAPGMPWLLSFL